MKNFCSTLLLVLVFGATALAQTTFSVAVDTAYASIDLPETTAAAHDTVVNLLDEPITISWTRFILHANGGVIQVCDPNNCYQPTVNSKNYTLPARDTGFMQVDLVDTAGLGADALVRIRYRNFNQIFDTVSAYYFLNVAASSGTTAPTNVVRVALYPNPVTEGFTLEHAEGVALVRVFSAEGRQVAEYAAMPGQRYSLAGQATGTYFVSLADKNGRIVRGLEIRKE